MDQPAPLRRKTHNLTIGRHSVPGATYFVTACTHERRPGLAGSAVAPAILAELTSAIGLNHLLIATVMPDHIHVLFRLGDQLTLSQISGRLKSQTKPALTFTAVEWQRDFFDRRLREDESFESYALYIFLNSYCAGLLPLHERWPSTVIGNTVRFRFLDSFETEKAVRPEWLGANESWEKSLRFSLGE